MHGNDNNLSSVRGDANRVSTWLPRRLLRCERSGRGNDLRRHRWRRWVLVDLGGSWWDLSKYLLACLFVSSVRSSSVNHGLIEIHKKATFSNFLLNAIFGFVICVMHKVEKDNNLQDCQFLQFVTDYQTHLLCQVFLPVLVTAVDLLLALMRWHYFFKLFSSSFLQTLPSSS